MGLNLQARPNNIRTGLQSSLSTGSQSAPQGYGRLSSCCMRCAAFAESRCGRCPRAFKPAETGAVSTRTEPSPLFAKGSNLLHCPEVGCPDTLFLSASMPVQPPS